MRKITRRSFLAAAAACGAAAALSACGGSSASSAAASSVASSTAASVSAAADGQKFTVGICQLVQHAALDAATQGFEDALTAAFGDNVTFDFQNAQGDSATCATITNGFVSSGVDLIMANATPALQAAQAATNTIPVLGTSVTEYGVALGLASGRSPALASLLSPIINGVRAVPGISWLPLALLWLGIGFRATVFLIALAGFFPAYLNAAAGAASVPPVLIRAGRMLGFGRRAIFFRVVIPSAMPQVRTGLRVALGMSFSYLVLGELTGVPDGLGAMIMDARLAGRVDLLVSGIILIALVGWLCDVLLMRALSAVSVSLRRQ